MDVPFCLSSFTGRVIFLSNPPIERYGSLKKRHQKTHGSEGRRSDDEDGTPDGVCDGIFLDRGIYCASSFHAKRTTMDNKHNKKLGQSKKYICVMARERKKETEERREREKKEKGRGGLKGRREGEKRRGEGRERTERQSDTRDK